MAHIKELIGWKFKGSKGRKLLAIMNSIEPSIRFLDNVFEENSIMFNQLQELGILEVLCEPVYKEEEKDSHILFAQWLSDNQWEKRIAIQPHQNKDGQYYSRKHCVCKTIEELFEMFKNR